MLYYDTQATVYDHVKSLSSSFIHLSYRKHVKVFLDTFTYFFSLTWLTLAHPVAWWWWSPQRRYNKTHTRTH